ncbi:sodium-dependent transporter [Bacillus cereus]|uniref:sodium-dependent transporter n=1 Tax=Bacillus cereus TaxID=1396 RepID=UPI00211D5113|nr:sodium-dependent transporter [Bacillus cereus]
MYHFFVSKGVEKGIEKASKYMMPLLFILFVTIIIRALTLDGAWTGIEFFLKPDFTKLTADTILYAMGQSFFSLTVGASVMVTYSSYLKREENLVNSAISIVSLTMLITLLAGIAIFPAIFAKIPFGQFFFILFLILFFFATLTSAISMLEIIVASVTKGNEKKRSSIPSALSFGIMSDVNIFGKTFFDLVDFTVSNILLPLGVLSISLFVPNKMDRKKLMKELEVNKTSRKLLFYLWFFLIRYIVPITVIIVFFNSLNIFWK